MKIIFRKGIFTSCMLLLLLAFLNSCKDEKDEPEPNIETLIRLDLDYLDFSAEGGEEEIGFETETNWKVITASESWLKVSPSEGKSGKATLIVNVAKNEESSERKTQIVIKTISGNATDTLTIRQAGVSRYVPIDWEKDAQLTQFNLQNGNVKIKFSDKAPLFTPEVSAIVVPTDTMSYIRVVKKTTVDGNSVTLQTVEGNMTDIFMNQKFSLSITPNPNAKMTKSGHVNTTDANGVIHPEKVIARMKDGNTITLYDAATKSENLNLNLWSKTLDYSNKTIYKSGNLHLYWGKCVFSANLGGNFYFDFNSEEKTIGGLKFKTGRLDNFYFFIDGNLNMDILLVLEAAMQEKGESIKSLLNNFVTLEPIFQVGGIPVKISIKADVLLETAYDIEAKATLTTGFNAGIGMKVGVNYINETIAPIFEPSYYFEPYPPTLTVLGSVETKASIYPYFKVRFYNFAGPNIAYKPFIGAKEAVGAAISTGPSQNFVGWQAGIYSQGVLEGSLSLEFIGTHTSKPINKDGNKNYILQMPAKIELVSPSEYNLDFTEGEPIEVCFRVTDKSVVDHSTVTSNAVVRVNVNGGKTDNTFYRTDSKGEIIVNYIPEKDGDYIEACIMDENGETINSAKFMPRLKESKIAGVWEIESGSAVFDENNNLLSSIKWTNTFTFNRDGSYIFIENPKKIIHQWTHDDFITTSLIHGYSTGSYIYKESEQQLAIQPGAFVNKSIMNGKPDPNGLEYVCEIFLKDGVYSAKIEENNGRSELWIKYLDKNGREVFLVATRPGASLKSSSLPASRLHKMVVDSRNK